jgi:hypothetical protein
VLSLRQTLLVFLCALPVLYLALTFQDWQSRNEEPNLLRVPSPDGQRIAVLRARAESRQATPSLVRHELRILTPPYESNKVPPVFVGEWQPPDSYRLHWVDQRTLQFVYSKSVLVTTKASTFGDVSIVYAEQ